MANQPPLPAGFPPLAPGFQFPPGTQIKVEHPLPPFDPGIQAKLDEARRSGKFFLAVVINDPTPDDPARLTCYQVRSSLFNRDWLLRGWQQICNMIVSAGVNPFPQAPAAPIPAPKAVEVVSDSASAASYSE